MLFFYTVMTTAVTTALISSFEGPVDCYDAIAFVITGLLWPVFIPCKIIQKLL